MREAYTRGISPAIIFGVMLTENARFISKAMSNVGAVGLMQVYPKVWLKKEFSDSLGKDLASDSTNLRYGVFILDKYFHPRTKSGHHRDARLSHGAAPLQRLRDGIEHAALRDLPRQGEAVRRGVGDSRSATDAASTIASRSRSSPG